MKDNAEDWLKGLEDEPFGSFNSNNGPRFKTRFLEQFKTIKKKAMWQQEFFNLKQEANTVDTYIARFKKLQRKVDPDGNFPADFIVQLFIKGLRPEYAIPVQAAIPENLTAAITHARHWEIGKAMATPEKDDVNDITKQLAQLYINSVMTQPQSTQQPQQPQPQAAYTAERGNSFNSRPNSSQNRTLCYYCGNPGHFMANCIKRRNDNQRNRNFGRGRSNNNYNNNNNRNNNNRRNYNNNRRNDYQRNRSRSRSRDRNYHDRDRSRDRSQERWGPRSNRSPSPYYRNVNVVEAQTSPRIGNWKRLLDNYSIRTALTAYITAENQELTKPQYTPTITPVKCYIDIQD